MSDEKADALRDAIGKHEASFELGYERALDDVRNGVAELQDFPGVNSAALRSVVELIDRLRARRATPGGPPAGST